MHNFFSESLGECGDELFLSRAETKHLFKTLRAGKGDVIGVFDGKGGCAEAEIVDDKRIVISRVERREEPDLKVHLFVAPPKRSCMDQLLRQCTEAGVWAVHPVICRYSVALPGKVSERWNTLLQEACKQSGNVFMPVLHDPVNLDVALEQIKREGMSSFYGAVVSDSQQAPLRIGGDAAWLVGPEGGFSDEEIRQIADCGASPLNLGPYIMRVETAAVCGVAALNCFYQRNSL